MKPNLTQRQLQVRQLIEQGLSNGEIAERLGISIGTVRNYKGLLHPARVGGPLTKQQREVADLVRLGFMDAEISNRLGMPVNTVGAYRQKLLHKMGARNATHLATILSQGEIAKLRVRVEELELLVIKLKEGQLQGSCL